jgi:hypothetical protein
MSYLAQIAAHDKSGNRGLRSTLVEEVWLRYHFGFFD